MMKDEMLDRPLEAVFYFNSRTFNCLKEARILTVRDLLSQTPTRLLCLKNFGRKCLMDVQEKLNGMSLHLRTDGIDYPTLDGDPQDIPLTDALELSTRATNVLHNARIFTLRKLLQTSPDRLLMLAGMGTTSLSEIKSQLASLSLSLSMTQEQASAVLDTLLQRTANSTPPIPEADPPAPDVFRDEDSGTREATDEDMTFVTLLEEQIARLEARDQAIMRYSYLNKKGHQTLEETGKKFNITRERARQLLERGTKQLRHRLSFRGFQEACQLIAEGGGVYYPPVGTIPFLNIKKKALAPYVGLIRHMAKKHSPQSKLTYDADYDVWLLDKGPLESFLEESALDLPPAADKERICDSISAQLGERVSNQVISHIADVYCRKHMARLKGTAFFISKNVSKRDLLEIILYAVFPEGAHFSTVSNKYNELGLREEIDQRNVLAALGLSDNLILWGRGSYRHKSTLALSDGCLDPILERLQELFAPGVNTVSVEALFSRCRTQAVSLGIESPYGLYGCLRWKYPKKFLYRHFPDIEARRSKNKPKAKRLEELEAVLRKTVGPVSLSEIVRLFGRHRKLKKYQVAQRLPDSEVTFLYDSGCYVHIDVLGLSAEIIGDIRNQVSRYFRGKRPFATVKELRFSMELPRLRFPWTLKLLGDIIDKDPNLSRHQGLIFAGELKKRQILELSVLEILPREQGMTLDDLNSELLSKGWILRPLKESNIQRMRRVSIEGGVVRSIES